MDSLRDGKRPSRTRWSRVASLLSVAVSLRQCLGSKSHSSFPPTVPYSVVAGSEACWLTGLQPGAIVDLCGSGGPSCSLFVLCPDGQRLLRAGFVHHGERRELAAWFRRSLRLDPAHAAIQIPAPRCELMPLLEEGTGPATTRVELVRGAGALRVALPADLDPILGAIGLFADAAGFGAVLLEDIGLSFVSFVVAHSCLLVAGTCAATSGASCWQAQSTSQQLAVRIVPARAATTAAG
ncbi:MAG: hypothetical protein ACI8UD_003767 [Planctomycetota bacterium]|jgi:hypothetical protein